MRAALETIIEALNARKNRVLLLAQVGMPASQFEAFRKLFLDEFGRSGFEAELERVLRQSSRTGTERAGRYAQRKEVHHECQANANATLSS